MDQRPIGMFDSGCGGLTVLKEFIKELPHEDFIYYGDTAHLPYGDKSKEKIIEYSEEIVKFLLQKDVKMIVIACGTASAMAYDYLKEKYSGVPIINIIEPTAKEVREKEIGVIATKGTIKSKAWEKAIIKYHPETHITSVACPLLVPLIEEGFSNHSATNLILLEYLRSFKDISSLILGCTHYPILKEQIQTILGNSINIINAGTYAAQETLKTLNSLHIENSIHHQGTLSFYSSDDFESFKENAKILDFYI